MLSETDAIVCERSESNFNYMSNDPSKPQDKQSVSHSKRSASKDEKSKFNDEEDQHYYEDNKLDWRGEKLDEPTKQTGESTEENKDDNETQKWESTLFLDPSKLSDFESKLISEGSEDNIKSSWTPHSEYLNSNQKSSGVPLIKHMNQHNLNRFLTSRVDEINAGDKFYCESTIDEIDFDFKVYYYEIYQKSKFGNKINGKLNIRIYF